MSRNHVVVGYDSLLAPKELAMLVLSRKVNEKICIGKDITVTVVDIDGSKIKLGIEAPAEVTVMRSELLDQRRAGQKTARKKRAGTK